MKRALLGIVAVISGSAFSAPLFPTIIGFDFNFGAYNRIQDTGAPAFPEWWMNALLPDTLTYTRGSNDHEVTALWPNWPNGDPDPIFGGQKFGGDFVLNVLFNGQDAPYTNPGGDQIDVSLVGTGANANGADLEIWGTVGVTGAPVLLWALELDKVSLYGKSSGTSYVLEGIGKIVGGEVAERNQLLGQAGVMRGQVDFVGLDGRPYLYDPMKDPGTNQYRVAFSGETGLGAPVPEPATIAGLMIGASALLLRRRRN